MISCIIPTYNRANFLDVNLSKLFSYNLDLEIIVVDDCSIDNTEDICKKYPVKYIKLHENSGCVSIPRAVGLFASTGKYICHIDDDVISLPQKFELTKYLDDYALVYGQRYEFSTTVNQEFFDYVNHEKFADRVKLIPNINWDVRETGVDGGQFIYRSDVYDKIPIHFSQHACDWELAKEVAKISNFKRVDIPVCVYCWHSNNITFDPFLRIRKLQPQNYKEYFVGKSWKVDWSIR